MKHDRKKDLRPLCAHVHDEDGLNPRFDRSDSQQQTANRKDQQLCKQVRRALDGHLSGVSWGYEAGLRIAQVEPHPDATRLRVLVQWPVLAATREQVLTMLAGRRGELRSIVAAAITRKRTPQLVFEAIPDQEVRDE